MFLKTNNSQGNTDLKENSYRKWWIKLVIDNKYEKVEGTPMGVRRNQSWENYM